MYSERVRDSNFELLRILSMLAIILTHVSAQGFDRELISHANNVVLYFLGSGSRIAVNLFLMTGVWFMVDTIFSVKRVLKLYGSLWFYSVTISILLVILGCDIGIRNLGSSFFPFLRRRMWFVSQYIALLLISPTLKLIVVKTSQQSLRAIVLIGFILISVISTLHSTADNWLDAFVWFAYIYLVIAYYKKYAFHTSKNKYRFLVISFVLYIAVVGGYVICLNSDSTVGEVGVTFFRRVLGDYKCVPNFCISFMLFVFFSRLDIGQNKCINQLSKNTLDVYMIHQQDAFIPIIWVTIFHTQEWQNSHIFLLLYLGTVLTVFVVGSIIGRLRVRYLEPLWIRSRLYNWLETKGNRFYSCLNLDNENL